MVRLCCPPYWTSTLSVPTLGRVLKRFDQRSRPKHRGSRYSLGLQRSFFSSLVLILLGLLILGLDCHCNSALKCGLRSTAGWKLYFPVHPDSCVVYCRLRWLPSRALAYGPTIYYTALRRISLQRNGKAAIYPRICSSRPEIWRL